MNTTTKLFTRCDSVDGEVLHLFKDSVSLENVDYVYAAGVGMAKSMMRVDNKRVNLSPCINVSVEIKTGERRVIEFFSDPLLPDIRETDRER